MRKQILFLFLGCFLFFANLSFAQELTWIRMDEALELQKKKPKKILLKVYIEGKDCGYCGQMDRETFTNKKLIRYVRENYYTAYINGEGNDVVHYNDFEYTNPNYDRRAKGRNSTHLFVNALQLSTYPSLVFFESDGSIIQAIEGFKDAQELELYLRMVATDEYKKITTMEAWEAYRKNFKSTF